MFELKRFRGKVSTGVYYMCSFSECIIVTHLNVMDADHEVYLAKIFKGVKCLLSSSVLLSPSKNHPK